MTRAQFDAGMKRLCLRHGKSLGREQADEWYQAIAGHDGVRFLAFAGEWPETHNLFPALADVLRDLREHRDGRDGEKALPWRTMEKPNLPASQLLLALYSCPGTLDAVDEIVAEWTRDHAEQRDLWERMGMAYLRERAA